MSLCDPLITAEWRTLLKLGIDTLQQWMLFQAHTAEGRGVCHRTACRAGGKNGDSCISTHVLIVKFNINIINNNNNNNRSDGDNGSNDNLIHLNS